jgi:hypothetical protein
MDDDDCEADEDERARVLFLFRLKKNLKNNNPVLGKTLYLALGSALVFF